LVQQGAQRSDVRVSNAPVQQDAQPVPIEGMDHVAHRLTA